MRTCRRAQISIPEVRCSTWIVSPCFLPTLFQWLGWGTRFIALPPSLSVLILFYFCALTALCNEPNQATRRQSSPPTINEALVRSAGIRKLSGQHVVIYTDLPEQPEIDQLPVLFDQAVPQWAEYFSVSGDVLERWKINGYVMRDKQRFQLAGLIPDNLPSFLHGYQWGHEMWIYEQENAYYRQHLLLHEGTHAFMKHFLGSAGPPWFMEGIAEMLGTHTWNDGQLQLGFFPKNRERLPYWGRVKIVRDEVRVHRAKTLATVMNTDENAFLDVKAYAWSWAATTLLDKHPRYQKKLREMIRHVNDPEFTRKIRELFEEDWDKLNEEWQLFVLNMNYGYDIAREAVVYRVGQPLRSDKITFKIAVDRGWQSSGVVLESDRRYRVSATGRFQIATSDQPWWCEPNGITIRYHDNRPLGILLGAIRGDPSGTHVTPLARPQVVGLKRKIRPKQSGTLFLRVNDSPAELAENVGSVEITVELVE